MFQKSVPVPVISPAVSEVQFTVSKETDYDSTETEEKREQWRENSEDPSLLFKNNKP